MPEDWDKRSHREAAIMLSDAHVGNLGVEKYDALVTLLALAYRKGALDGMTRAQEIMREVMPS